MDRSYAQKLIHRYFDSWVDVDKDKFLSTLHGQATVRECTGAVMRGTDVLQRWFEQWNGEGNKVLYWTIKHMGFDEEKSVGFIEWDFSCLFEGRTFEWDGSSIVYFKDSLIYELNEYQMQKDKFFPYSKSVF